MTNKSLAKDFHRLLKRIGPLTEGQASIDTVDWDNDSLTSFSVIIRPNAGAFKMGRFKFTISIPDGYLAGAVPIIRCDTQLPHPNIDPWIDEGSNICLNILEQNTWTPSIGLEGIILGILFLIHNPNFDSVLCEEGPDIFEDFEEGVKQYMATGEVDGFEYDIDFRVVDGKFVDLKKESSEQTDIGNSKSERDITKKDSSFICPALGDVVDDDFDRAVYPVRFVMANDNNDGHGAFFYTAFNSEEDGCPKSVEKVKNETISDFGSSCISNGHLSTSEDSVVNSDTNTSTENDCVNDQEAMDIDDTRCDSCQLPDHSKDMIKAEKNKGSEMDCLENNTVKINTFALDSIVRPLQRTVTVFDLSESGFSTFMSRSVSLPTHFQFTNTQPSFLTYA